MTTAPPIRQKSGLALYFTVTFAASWAFWLIAIVIGGPAMSFPTMIPYLLGAFGPSIGAIAVRVARRLRHGPVPEHTVRTRLNARLLWVPALLVIAAATVVAAVAVEHMPSGHLLDPAIAQKVIQAYGGVGSFIGIVLIGGPLPEEPGWRGTAYPRMRARLGRFQATLLLGVIWAAWHLPLFWVTGTPQNMFGLASPSGVLYLVSVVPMAMLTVFAYERAGVLASMAVHLGINAAMNLTGVAAPTTTALILGIQGIVAVALMAASRPRTGPGRAEEDAAVRQSA